MHPYIPHLLADIAAAHRTEIPEEENIAQTIDEEIKEVEEWAENVKPDYTFGYYCGLKSENFPPAEQLTNDEMILIRGAYEKMMFTWNHGIELPDNLPVTFAYKMIVDTLDMATTIVDTGFMNFHFCKSHPPDCVFKEYCPCLKTWSEESGTKMGPTFLARMMAKALLRELGDDDISFRVIEEE